MALSRNYQLCFIFAITALCFFSHTFLPPKSGGIKEASRNEEELRKMILGSRPPGCVNKCMSCSPCEAILVIPPLKKNKMIKRDNNNYYHQESLWHRDDDRYYLLSWKCRCGNKLYQP
ncbi:hypothetical protein CASFOL_026030 [Castilleja foliolosa]|uniref:Epidermal patterning factor-like protein n=1 Tax=Castilleja foliolosa TaxID=1961234 RepID=A0ABD3CUP1_9LAMI